MASIGRLLGEVEHARGGHCGRAAVAEHVGHVRERAGTAGRDHGDRHRGADPCHRLDVVALHHAVFVDRLEQDLTGAELLDGLRDVDRITPGRDSSRLRAHFIASRVDRHDDALRTELVGGLADDVGRTQRRGADHNLVGADAEQRAHVVDGARHRRRPPAA